MTYKESSSSQDSFSETLELLEWPRLCMHLSTFASTSKGLCQCKDLCLPNDISASRERLGETLEILVLDGDLDGGLSFQGIFDIDDILLNCKKGGISSGEELLKVAETLKSARRIRRQIDDSSQRPFLTALLTDLATLPELEKLLRFGLEDGGRIADRASSKLAKLRAQLQSLKLERNGLLKVFFGRYTNIIQDRVIAIRNGRPVLALKAGADEQIPGIIHDTSSSGNTVFLEPKAIIPLGNRIVELELQAFEEEQRLLSEWSVTVGDKFSIIHHLSEAMTLIDVALARARYGKWSNGVHASLGEDSESPLLIKDFRHPLLLWQEFYEDGAPVVPISLEVSSELRVVAITGPNTGGKTVALKSIGLAVLMARCGLLLPCSGSPRLPWFQQVFADIGDEQSLQQNLSTFSGHILRIGRILDAIRQKAGTTMVLLDEVGAGTDPTEGTAIAIALLKVLAERVRLTIATTHFGELKALKYSDDRFENASVEFDVETISPSFHLQWGVPGVSNALAIASRLGLDSAVIDSAKNLIGPKGLEDINEVIRGLERDRQHHQEAAEAAASLLARTELLHEELLDRWHKQCEQSEELEELGRQKLELTIREGQKEVRTLIRRLRDPEASGETARQAGQRLREMTLTYNSETKNRNDRSWFPKVGERIRLNSISKSGEVISISSDGNQLTVLCGVFRSTVDISSVESLDGQKVSISEPLVEIKTTGSPKNDSLVRTNRNTIDVRGLRVYEAEAVVEAKLRDGIGPIWVIHGIGTGKLKIGLRKWLSNLPYVHKVTDAEQTDGGAGCSVVWLD